MARQKLFVLFDILLFAVLAAILAIYYLGLLTPSVSQTLFAVIAVIATLPVIFRAATALKNKKVTIDLLAAIALVVSILAKEWPSAVFISLMLTSARIFANYTDSRAGHAIASLLKLKPKTAKIEKNGRFIEAPADKIRKGDLVVVELGERIPVDGIIEKGAASIDQSSLTGESLPVAKEKGDQVLSSTFVVEGNLVVRAEKVGQETTFEKIIDLVERSQTNKAKITTLADKFTVGILLLTMMLAASVYFATSGDLNFVLAILLVTCADDIAVAIPMAFTAAIGHGAKRGVIIKGSNYLEALGKVKTIVVDKTGTLTYGRLKVEEFFAFDAVRSPDALQLAGTACALSNHPSAKAIVRYLDGKNINFSEPDSFDEQSGKGAVAFYRDKKIITGKLSFFEEIGYHPNQEQLAHVNAAKEKGLSITLLGANNVLLGFFALADEIKPRIREAVSELKKLGIEKVVMLTGDNEKIAKRVADAAGISHFHANLLPEDKISHLKEYLGQGKLVAMIGDGVNDAAVLSLADVGIAMGLVGADAAIESADIVLMRDDFSKLAEIIRLSKFVSKIARQDFWIWGIINVAGLGLVFAGLFPPTSAAAYNFITDFVPILNSMRLFAKHFVPSYK